MQFLLTLRRIKIALLSAGLFLFISVSLYAQTEEPDAIFILKGKTELNTTNKSLEGVQLELKKSGKSIQKISSDKRGRYYLQLGVSTSNKENEYMLYISMDGTVPKTLKINTYIPPGEFGVNNVPRYEFDLNITMTATTEKDIIVQRPSGKIIWDSQARKFQFDQKFAILAQKEDDAAKKKAEEEARLKAEAEAKLKADEEARLKAEAEAKLKADELAKLRAEEERKQKEEAERIVQANLKAMQEEMRRKRQKDSLDSLAMISAGKTKVEINRLSRPVTPKDVDENAFDGTGAYSINIAKKALKAYLDKKRKEKANNLSAKYETNNTLTSLLNMVDEHDKMIKKQ